MSLPAKVAVDPEVIDLQPAQGRHRPDATANAPVVIPKQQCQRHTLRDMHQRTILPASTRPHQR